MAGRPGEVGGPAGGLAGGPGGTVGGTASGTASGPSASGLCMPGVGPPRGAGPVAETMKERYSQVTGYEPWCS